MVTINDEIHRNIEFNDFEKKLIDSEEFQRLRRIKQLAMTYLVYPSATHTRFEHALGTMHLSSLICKKLNLEEELTQKIRAYSLLHDIGHTAFSHESEKILENKFGNHEKIGEKKILEGELKDIIKEKYNPKEIIKISQTLYGKIVSSAIGSDRMDYLLRDSHNTGVGYGVIDSERIIHTIFLDEKKKIFGLTLGGLEAAESLLVGRFMMFSAVYLHHTVRIASSMLIKSLSSAIESNSLTPEDLLHSSDEQIFFKLLNSEKESKKLAERLLRRNLMKVAYSIVYSEEIENNIEKIKKEIETKFKNEYIIDIPLSFSHSYDIPILDKEGNLNPIDFHSALINSLKETEKNRRKILFLCNNENKEELKKIIKTILS